MSRRSDFDAPTPVLPAAAPPPRGLVRSRTVTVSSAQLLALHTTPVPLVPVEDPAAVICPVALHATYHAGSTGYTGDGTVGVVDATWDTANRSYFNDVPMDVFGTADASWHLTPGHHTLPLDQAAGQPMNLSAPSASPLTAGNGSLTVIALYFLA